MHGVIRFQQGKGFLVTALLPLIAALAWRWLALGKRIDLAALFLANIVAIGLSANGLYGGPAAIGFVAVAVVAADFRSPTWWRRAALLALPCAYPIVVAALILYFHLALPSEQVGVPSAISELDFVVSTGLIGRVTLVGMAFVGLGLLQLGRSRAVLVYFPLAMLIALDPVGAAAIAAVTGNLGFRIFWSLPIAGLAGLLMVAVLRLVGVRRERWLDLVAVIVLMVSAAIPTRLASPATAIAWHRPGLKVDGADYALARRVAALAPPGCRILAPERYSVLLSMIRDAPKPVFVRRLYLVHYRFTLPPDEIALRDRLRRVAEGATPVEPPSPDLLSSHRLPIGLVAVRADAPYRRPAATLAARLHLPGPVAEGPLLIWRGPCGG